MVTISVRSRYIEKHTEHTSAPKVNIPIKSPYIVHMQSHGDFTYGVYFHQIPVCKQTHNALPLRLTVPWHNFRQISVRRQTHSENTLCKLVVIFPIRCRNVGKPTCMVIISDKSRYEGYTRTPTVVIPNKADITDNSLHSVVITQQRCAAAARLPGKKKPRFLHASECLRPKQKNKNTDNSKTNSPK